MKSVLFVRGKGAPAWEASVLRDLAPLGYDSKFLISRANKELEDSIQVKGRNYSSSDFIERVTTRTSLFRFLNFVLNVKTAEYTTRYSKSSELFQDWDIIHLTDDYYSPGLQASKYNSNLVMTVWENVPFNRSLEEGRPTRTLRSALFQKVKRFFPVTEESAAYLESYGISPERMEVIHPGIDVDTFSESKIENEFLSNLVEQGRKIILGVSRIEFAKGLTYTLRALKELKKEYRDFVYLHVGIASGRFGEYFGKMVKQSDLQDHVVMAGRVDYNQMPQFYSASSLFLLPSVPTLPWEEQLGFSILEAMSCKRCVIASNLPALREVIASESGILFPSGNYKELKARIHEALTDDSMRKDIGGKARKRVVAEFNAKHTAKKYAKAYDKILTG